MDRSRQTWEGVVEILAVGRKGIPASRRLNCLTIPAAPPSGNDAFRCAGSRLEVSSPHPMQTLPGPAAES
jgi:hypothetical protein